MLFVTLFLAMSVCGVVFCVAEKPIAPLGVEPYPSDPAVDAQPEVTTWTSDGLGGGWRPVLAQKCI
jgi:hypothetical protein